MKPTKYYYALQWPMGYCMRQTISGRSVEFCFPWRFTTRAERDAWVARGSDFTRSNNYREIVRRRDIACAARSADAVWDENGRFLHHLTH
jgi:hypothetical protein